jgi:hypothetical protein
MQFEDTIKDIARAVASDTGLAGWCSVHYQSDLTVYINVDGRKLPQVDDCPYVALLPDEKILGEYERTDRLFLEIISTVYDEELVIEPDTKIKVYEGVFRAEKFRQHVARIIAGVDLGRISIATLSVKYDTFEAFPYLNVAQRFELVEPLALGGGNPITNE